MKYRMRFFDAHVRSRMTYACQTWSLSKSQRDKLDSAQMKLLRQMVTRGNSYRGQYNKDYESDSAKKEIDYGRIYSNARIYEITGSCALSDYIGNQQAKFVAPTVRGDNFRETKQLMFPDKEQFTKSGNGICDLLRKYKSMELDNFLRAARSREF